MTLPRVDTVVTYPSGAVVSSGTIVHVEPLDDGRVAALLDQTACHPVDAAWPDQGADRARLIVGGQEFAVDDCVVGVTDGARLFLGPAVPVRPGAEGWVFVVAHVLDPDAAVAAATDSLSFAPGAVSAAPASVAVDVSAAAAVSAAPASVAAAVGQAPAVALALGRAAAATVTDPPVSPAPPAPVPVGTTPAQIVESPESDGIPAAVAAESGDSVVVAVGTAAAGDGALVVGATARVEVDAAYRRALSAGHTACHLASLALNQALAGAWSKEVSVDGRGHPNFDQFAIESSTIEPDGSLDVYRIGKSLRKQGFTPAALTEGGGLGALAAAVDSRLAEWCASGARVEVWHDGDERGLSGRRTWTCHLPDGAVSIPCGGTHLGSLVEFGAVRVAFDLVEQLGALELRMRTTATLAPDAPSAG